MCNEMPTATVPRCPTLSQENAMTQPKLIDNSRHNLPTRGAALSAAAIAVLGGVPLRGMAADRERPR